MARAGGGGAVPMTYVEERQYLDDWLNERQEMLRRRLEPFINAVIHKVLSTTKKNGPTPSRFETEAAFKSQRG
jgi:hypothetical protein